LRRDAGEQLFREPGAPVVGDAEIDATAPGPNSYDLGALAEASQGLPGAGFAKGGAGMGAGCAGLGGAPLAAGAPSRRGPGGNGDGETGTITSELAGAAVPWAAGASSGRIIGVCGSPELVAGAALEPHASAKPATSGALRRTSTGV
jgi:hypothetical protein